MTDQRRSSHVVAEVPEVVVEVAVEVAELAVDVVQDDPGLIAAAGEAVASLAVEALSAVLSITP